MISACNEIVLGWVTSMKFMKNMDGLSGGKGTWYLRLVSVVEAITKCIWPSLGGLDMVSSEQ